MKRMIPLRAASVISIRALQVRIFTPTLEEKAANLLYFITKNHSFSDGNKRIAATMFLYFLDKNGILFADGNKLIDDHTLVALTIMIAESKPDEKEMMISVIMNCICG